ncbi:uncharacterized protein LOC117241146, partial [Aduncisulcus paluster]
KKCKFAMREVEHLGVVISEEGIKISPRRLLKVERFSDLKDKKEVRSFLGVINFFRKHIPTFAKTVQPITMLLKKDTVWTWGKDQVDAVRKIVKEINTQTVLSFPTGRGVIHLYTDAS